MRTAEEGSKPAIVLRNTEVLCTRMKPVSQTLTSAQKRSVCLKLRVSTELKAYSQKFEPSVKFRP